MSDQPTETAQDAGRLDPQTKRILVVIAALAAWGLYYVAQEYMPGPWGAPRFYNRGVEAYNKGDDPEAMRWFDRAIGLDSE